MMELKEDLYLVNWRIENFSHWSADVHGKCIKSPEFHNIIFSLMELYPKGISGQDRHLVVRFDCVQYDFSGHLSVYSSDGTLMCNQYVNALRGRSLELPPGPEYQDVLSQIREKDDVITVRLRSKHSCCYERSLRTVINGFKFSLDIYPILIPKMKSGDTITVFHINYSTSTNSESVRFKICQQRSAVSFSMAPLEGEDYPFAVEGCMCLTPNDDSDASRVWKQHVFRDKIPWIFPYPLYKKSLIGERISLFFCFKTKNLIQDHSYTNFEQSYLNIELNDITCFPEKEPSAKPDTSNKDTVPLLAREAGCQTSVTSDGSVSALSTDLMCLFQDQDFSDFQLKCHNVTFPVHKAILTARSSVFKTMLSINMTESMSSEVDIDDLDPSTLGLFLSYLYTGTVENLDCDRALKLYYASDKYQVSSLKKDCRDFLCAEVSISNVCDIISLADRHRDEQMTLVSHDFILNNYNEVLKSNEWKSFMCTEPLLAVTIVTDFAAKDSVRKHDPKWISI